MEGSSNEEEMESVVLPNFDILYQVTLWCNILYKKVVVVVVIVNNLNSGFQECCYGDIVAQIQLYCSKSKKPSNSLLILSTKVK